jgi:formamidopyrimidine-DNA glycosylase
MPEGDTIFRAARTLHQALAGQVVTGFDSQLPQLSRVDFDSRITQRRVEKVEAIGKWLLMHFSGDIILLTHMLMSGSWHIYRPGEAWQRPGSDMRIVVKTEKIWGSLQCTDCRISHCSLVAAARGFQKFRSERSSDRIRSQAIRGEPSRSRRA